MNEKGDGFLIKQKVASFGLRPPYTEGLSRHFWCRGGDLDSRPRAYESPALPLSYLGMLARFATPHWRTVPVSKSVRAPNILLWEERFVNTRSKCCPRSPKSLDVGLHL